VKVASHILKYRDALIIFWRVINFLGLRYECVMWTREQLEESTSYSLRNTGKLMEVRNNESAGVSWLIIALKKAAVSGHETSVQVNEYRGGIVSGAVSFFYLKQFVKHDADVNRRSVSHSSVCPVRRHHGNLIFLLSLLSTSFKIARGIVRKQKLRTSVWSAKYCFNTNKLILT
jgi:hypothetical protein